VDAGPLILLGGALTLAAMVGAWLVARRLRVFKPDRSVGSTDEDADAFGTEVAVLVRVTEHQAGRIQFQGTSWPARSVHGALEPGERARIVDRENLVWIVEPLAPMKLTS